MPARLVRFMASVLVSATIAGAQVPVQTFELQERWRRGAEDDELFFGALGRVVVDEDGTVFASDSQLSEVFVLSSGGELLRTISGPGEGPGEVNQPADMYYGLGGKIGLLQAFPGKIVQLDPDGTPLERFPLPETPGGGFQVVLRSEALEDRLVLAGQYQVQGEGQGMMQRKYLKAVTADGKPIATYYESDTPFRWGGMEYVESSFSDFSRRWSLLEDGRVAAALEFSEYQIHVWAPDGTLESVIERPGYEPIERTAEEREVAQALFDAIITFNPGSTFRINDHHPAIVQTFAQPGGELWVLTGRGTYRRPEGVAVAFDVFDARGDLVREVQIVGDVDPENDSLFLFGDRLVAVTAALGAAMSAMGGEDVGDDGGDIEPSTLVSFDLVPVD